MRLLDYFGASRVFNQFSTTQYNNNKHKPLYKHLEPLYCLFFTCRFKRALKLENSAFTLKLIPNLTRTVTIKLI